MAKLGRPKVFKTPDELWDKYQEYRAHIIDNPHIQMKWMGKEPTEKPCAHQEPPTWRGFEDFLCENGMLVNLSAYRNNRNGAYKEFSPIIRAIGNGMFRRKFLGAAVGEYQHNIIAREIGLGEAQEISLIQRPILEGGQELPDDDEDLTEEEPDFEDDDILK